MPATGDIRKKKYSKMQKASFFTVFCIAIFFTSMSIAQNTDYDFSIQDPYPVAVEKFFNAVFGAVEEVDNKEEITEWADGFSQRLPEFLEDMIAVSESMYQQSLGSLTDNDFATVEEFVEKWEGVITTCPGCENLAPLVAPIIEEFFDGFPRIRDKREGDSPFQRYFEVFQEIEALNPWGTGGFFRVEPLTNFRSSLNIFEVKQEHRSNGYEEIIVSSRETREIENNQTTFFEFIENDKVTDVGYSKDSITMMHEALMNLKLYGGDPEVIEGLYELVNLIDEKLRQAWEDGFLEDFSYYYFFNQGPVKNEIIHSRHPLLKDPHIQDFKVAEYYPRGNIPEILLSPPQLPPAPPVLIPAAESFVTSAENVAGVWILGIVFPMYLMTFVSFVFKGLFF